RDKLVPTNSAPTTPSPLWGDISEKLFVLQMRRFAAGAVVAAIVSGVEARSASCRRADCGDKYSSSRHPAKAPPGKA
ncbi:MAG: hypothetical protein AB7D37_21305, partial [Desulfovibrio sp.]